MHDPLQIIAIAGIPLLFYAAWRDVATRTIPDEISIAIAALGLVVRSFDGWSAALLSMGVGALVFILLLLLAMRGVLGGADVKLAAALAIGLPPAATWDFIFLSVLCGGVLGVVYIITRRRYDPSRFMPPALPNQFLLRRVLVAEARRLRRGGPLPYAVAIAVGGSFTLLTQVGT